MSKNKKKTAGQHRDFDVTERVNEIKQRGENSTPSEVEPASPKEKVSGESVKRLDNLSSQEVVQQQQKKSNDLAREEARIKAEMDSTKVAFNSEANSTITVSDVEAEKMKLDSEKRIKSWGMKAKVIGGLGIGAFALASVMDTSQTLEEKRNTSRMTEEQEGNLTRKASKEEKNQRQNAYGHTDMGDIVTEMWNNRIGHHKMGNSKFQ